MAGSVKQKIVKRWVDLILARYPIKPVIEIVEYVEECAEKIVDGFLRMYDGEKNVNLEEPLDDLMRYLATDKNLSPGDSMRLLVTLKHITAEEMGVKGEDKLRLYEVMDEIAYKAFDCYMACREEIFELRLKEKDRDLEIMRRIIEFAKKAEDFKF